MEHKLCRWCGQVKPHRERRRYRKDGTHYVALESRCEDCSRVATRESLQRSRYSRKGGN